MTSTGRVARLTALALATGTLVAAGAGTAGASSTQKTNFTATGGGNVLTLTVNLPVAIPGIGDTITTNLVSTGSTLRTADVKAVTTSALGTGSKPDLLAGLLDDSITAEYGKAQPAAKNVFPAALAQLGISGDVLALTSKAASPLVDGTVAQSVSKVVDLRVGDLANLNAVLNALVAQLTGAFDVALGTLTGQQASAVGIDALPTSTVTSTLTGLVNQITATTGTNNQAVNTLVSQLNALPDTLSTLLTNTLKSKLTAAAADPSLLHVGEILSTQDLTRQAGVVRSTSSETLTDISALGGLIKVSALKSSATAALGNGVAEATPMADDTDGILTLNVADVLKAQLGKDLGIDLSSTALPPAVVDAVNTALAQVTGLLSGLLQPVLTSGQTSRTVSADRVSAAASAATFTVNPGGLFAKPILSLALAPSNAEVVRANAAVPPVVTTPAAAHSTPVFAPTGANFALTAPIAISLMGLAVVARRRRLAHLG